MFKLIVIAALVSLIVRLATRRWPWEFLTARPTRGLAEFEARKLLGVAEDASREEIVAAHRQRVAQVHPDRGGTAARVNEADAARDLLLRRLGDNR
jgi:DnaJ homolog subfamily C member 19